jgi:hypothetical protein
MALEMALRRMKAEGATVHGFRSAFRDYRYKELQLLREKLEWPHTNVIFAMAAMLWREGNLMQIKWVWRIRVRRRMGNDEDVM